MLYNISLEFLSECQLPSEMEKICKKPKGSKSPSVQIFSVVALVIGKCDGWVLKK